MDPLTIASLGLGLGQLVFGAKQRADADSLKASNYIPPAAVENQKLAQLMNNSTMYPGQEADKAALDRNMSNTIGVANRTSKSGSDILNLAGALNTQKNNAVMDMSKRFAQYKNQALSNLMNANSQVAGYQNQNQQQYLSTKRSLIDAGNRNIYGGLSNAATSIALSKTGFPSYNGNPLYRSLNRWDASQMGDYNLPDQSQMFG
jgi:hypothetical protein